MATTHSAMTGSELHVPGYAQAGDPGAVGGGKQWIDSSAGTGKWALKIRKEDDLGWETVYDPAAVAINGGTINGVTIGATTPAAGAFTTLAASSDLTVGGSVAADKNIIVAANAGQSRRVIFRTGALNRWFVAVTSTTESGANAGSDLGIFRVSDAGALIDAPLMLTRSSGKVQTVAELGVGTNLGLNGAAFGTSALGVLAIKNGTPPSTSPADGVQVFAADVSSSSELRVRDEAGNVTTLSPHNPQMVDVAGRISDFVHKEFNPAKGVEIELDMFGALAALEALTESTFIYSRPLSPLERENPFTRRLLQRRATLKEKMIHA